MLSLEKKKAVFHSFKLKEKQISHGRVNFVYPESKQKGQVIATQLHPNGNGYVIGKYMAEDMIRKNGYKVDTRGWISIKDFSERQLVQVIGDAMESMSKNSSETVVSKKEIAVNITETPKKAAKREPVIKVAEAGVVTEFPKETKDDDVSKTPIQTKPAPQKKGSVVEEDPYLQNENYSCSYLFAWVGLSLSLMETGFLIWRNSLRKYSDVKTQIKKDQ